MIKLKYKIIEFWDFIIRDVPNFFRNIWLFRNGLLRHRWYDHAGVILFMRDAISDISNGIDKRGYEEKISKDKKVQKMKRLTQLLDNYTKDNYLDLAQERLGYKLDTDYEFKQIEGTDYFEMVDNKDQQTKEKNDQIYKLALQISREEWNEIWDILKGQDYSNFDPKKDFDSQIDGSGLNSWWN